MSKWNLYLINLYIFYKSFHMCTINTWGENPTSIHMCCMFACVCSGTLVHVWYASQKGRGCPEPWVANDPIPPTIRNCRQGWPLAHAERVQAAIARSRVCVTKRTVRRSSFDSTLGLHLPPPGKVWKEWRFSKMELGRRGLGVCPTVSLSGSYLLSQPPSSTMASWPHPSAPGLGRINGTG